jgi:hypothetical protein
MWRLLFMFCPPIKTLCSIGNDFFLFRHSAKISGKKKHWLQTDTFVWRLKTERWRWDAEGNRKG